MRAWLDTRVDQAGRDRTSLLSPAIVSGDAALDLGWGQVHLDRKLPGPRPEHCHAGCLQVMIPLTPVRWTQSWHDGVGCTRRITETGLFFFVAPAGIPHATTLHGTTDLLNLFIDVCALRTLPGADALGRECPPSFGQQDIRIRSLASLFQAECRDPGSGHRLHLQGLLLALAAGLLPSRQSSGAPSRSHGGLPQAGLQRVTELIEHRLGSNLGLGEMAMAAGVSLRHFQRCFQQATGTSPARYVMLRRVDRAKTLLCGTALSLAEVALQCGFCDQAHLTTTFRRLAGTAPGAYRRHARGLRVLRG